MTTITPQELQERLGRGEAIDLIDVRTPVEFREVHVECARNVPLDRFDATAIVAESRQKPGRLTCVICQKGSRGKEARERLAAAGLESALNVEGGTLACVSAGLPVKRGKKAISLERQVRMVAGSMVLIGSLLGYFHSPLWFALSGFVGAGLLFAGLTDTCGMAILLGRMPWNQVSCLDSPAK